MYYWSGSTGYSHLDCGRGDAEVAGGEYSKKYASRSTGKKKVGGRSDPWESHSKSGLGT